MKTYDNTIKYYELIMYNNNTSKYEEMELPKGYHWEYYKQGDELEWVDIHISSREFTSIDRGLKYFEEFYGSFKEELNKRCIFIVEDETNKKIGTVTISKLKEPQYGYNAVCDWLAIRSDYQGKKLSKILINKMIQLANNLGYERILLHTQTTTWLAAKLYLDNGFEIYNKKNEGWNILKTLTNHPKLKDYIELSHEKIYDKTNQKIEELLINIYKSDDFNYSVWNKNNMNKVYTYINKTPHEYKYFINNESIKLIEVESEYKK